MIDPYTYPNGTLRNKFGIRDPTKLEAAERELTNTRQAEILERGPTGPFDVERLKATHGYLFQDVYDWAGELRISGIGRPQIETASVHWFPPPQAVPGRLTALFEDLKQEDALRGLSREAFADRAAEYFVRLNNAHPFRDGNGRTQRNFFRALAREAGHDLTFSVVSRERMTQISILGHSESADPARRMFREITDPEQVGHLRKAISFLEANNFNWNDRYLAALTPGQGYDGVVVAIGPGSFMMHDGTALFVGHPAAMGRSGASLPDPEEAVSFVAQAAGDRGRGRGFER